MPSPRVPRVCARFVPGVLVVGAILFGWITLPGPARGGGPLVIRSITGTGLAFPGTVQVYTDLGGFGPTLTHAQADGWVVYAYDQWRNVSTASFDYQIVGDLSVLGFSDITAANADTIIGVFNGGDVHVIYDDDGTILSDFFGAPPGVLGLSTPEYRLGLSLAESYVVLNGAAVDPADVNGDYFAGVFTHETGHSLNLAHTQANGAIYWFSDDIGPDGCSTPYGGSPGPGELETMYPFINPVFGGDGIQVSTVDARDDIASFSDLYPAGGWPTAFGTISGFVYGPGGLTEATGVNLVARNVADPFGDCITTLSGELTQGERGPDGEYEIAGLTPGANYVLYIDGIVAGGFATPEASIPPSAEEYYNGGSEDWDPGVDDRCQHALLTPIAGSTLTADLFVNEPYLPINDDGWIQVPLPFSFPFCGQSYSTAFVNGNGFVTFGAQSVDATPTVGEFLVSAARIAPLWTDLDPVGGEITAEEIGGEFVIRYVSVPEAGTNNVNTFSIVLRSDGSFAIDYDRIDAVTGMIVGRTPGNMVPDPGESNLGGLGQPISGETVYEFFDGDAFDLEFQTLEFEPCSPGVSCLTVSFPGDTAAAAGPLTLQDLCVINCGANPDTVLISITETAGWCTPPSPVQQVIAAGDTACVTVACVIPPSACPPDSSVLMFVVESASAGIADTAWTVVRVQNQEPQAACLPVTVVVDGAGCVAAVAASQVDDGSFDPDGDPVGLELLPSGPYPAGTTPVSLVVTDPCGAADTCQTTVTVRCVCVVAGAPSLTTGGAGDSVYVSGMWMTNCGSDPDSMRWSVFETGGWCAPPAPVVQVLAAGDTVWAGVWCLIPPGSCPPDSTELILVAESLTTGAADTTRTTVRVGGSAPVALSRNLTVQGTASGCAVNVNPDAIDAGSFDPDGGAVVLQLVPSGPYVAGTTPVDLIATDPCGMTDTSHAEITVECVTRCLQVSGAGELIASAGVPVAVTDLCVVNCGTHTSPVRVSIEDTEGWFPSLLPTFPRAIAPGDTACWSAVGLVPATACGGDSTVLTLIATTVNSGVSGTTMTVVRVANAPPVARCRNLEVAGDTADCVVAVDPGVVDDGSFDPDGDSLTVVLSPPGPYSPGVNVVDLIVTDPCGLADTCQATISVVCDCLEILCPPDAVVARGDTVAAAGLGIVNCGTRSDSVLVDLGESAGWCPGVGTSIVEIPPGDTLFVDPVCAIPPGACPPDSTAISLVATSLRTGWTDTCGVTLRVGNAAPVVVGQSLTVLGRQPGCAVQVGPEAFDAGSFDPDGDSLSLFVAPPGPYVAGTTPLLLIAVDSCGLADTAAVEITVECVGACLTASCAVSDLTVGAGDTVSVSGLCVVNCGTHADRVLVSIEDSAGWFPSLLPTFPRLIAPGDTVCWSAVGFVPGPACAPDSTILTLIARSSTRGVADTCKVVIRVACPRAEIDPAGVFFTGLAFGDTVCREVTIRNVGEAPLDILSVAGCDGGDFFIDAGGLSATIPPGDSTSFRVCVDPAQAGPDSCTITVTTSDITALIPVGHGTVVDVPGDPPLPAAVVLLPSVPNPFLGSTELRFDLPRETPVRLRVFDSRGRLVRRLLDGDLRPAGSHRVRWDGRDGRGRVSAGGIYFVRLDASGAIRVVRTVRIR